MKLNRTMLGGLIIVLILGSWIGNVLFFRQMQLKEPLFLKHHMTLHSDHPERISFHYLENKYAGKKVTGIQLADYPQIHFQLNQDLTYTHQTSMRATAEFHLSQVELQGKLPLVIKDVFVFYNEGPPAMVPIGEIRIDEDQGKGVLDFLSSSATSDGLGNYSVRTTQEVELVQVGTANSERLKSWLNLKLADVPVSELKLPIKLDKNEEITLSYQWSIPDHERAAYEIFQSEIQLHFRMEDGRTVVEKVPITKSYQLTNAQVHHLVRTGGELD